MIRRLPSHVVQQIAAGEVIERPSSVLKELIENSLDAGASKIWVEYEEGGLKRLSVEDNGHGMTEEDLPLAFESHATSKLNSLEDLNELHTLGFRGEALSSIGTVGDLEILTSSATAPSGWCGRVSYGCPLGLEAIDKRFGTCVTVRNLFLKHPARLKFMKSTRSESLQLLNIWKRYTLSRSDIFWSFKESQTGKEIKRFPESVLERALWYFCREKADGEQWEIITEKEKTWKLNVIFLKPHFLGTVRPGICLFLNQRPFRDSKLEFAVKRAFEGFTDLPKKITAVLFLEGDPQEFDVNVHPSKTEIRFLKSESLFSFIVRTIRFVLEKEHKKTFISPSFSFERPVFEIPKAFVIPNEALLHSEPERSGALSECEGACEESHSFHWASSCSYEYLGSLDNTYWMVKKNSELFLFDQHALHERILYEQLLEQIKKEKIESQRLLFPLPVHLEQVHILLEQETLLEQLGFELRTWNEATIQVIAAPALLKRNYEAVLEKIIHCQALSKEVLLRETLASIACHSAVRAHDSLSRVEVLELLQKFQTEDALGHCPHGRPTFVRFQIKDLEKWFHRVM